MRTLTAALLALILFVPATHANFTLTVLHNNDGESQLIHLGEGLEDYGGVARFKSKADSLKRWADANTDGWLMLTSGDNILSGPEWNASLADGIYYDALAIDMIGYHALCLGNHDFDFGPSTLADFISSVNHYSSTWFLSCNLEFSGEPKLNALAGERIAESRVFEVNNERIGVIGATTPNVDFVSSTGNIGIEDDVVAEVKREVESLTADGIEIIVLICHLQGIEEDIAMIPELSNVDIVIAGGGDELLATLPDDPLIPGDQGERYGDYPMYAVDADGHKVPVVTTKGNYGYLGVLVAEFDNEGRLLRVDDENSGPRVVAGESLPGGVPPNPMMQEKVVEPVMAYMDALDENVLATSEVVLDGIRNHVRSRETNLGNLIADAFLWNASRLHDDYSAPRPEIALQNGGGIRNDTRIEPGEITELTTFSVLPFGNILTVVHDLSPHELKAVMENAVAASKGGSGTGRFAQISGFRFEYHTGFPAQTYDEDNEVAEPGQRVRNAWLDDGTVLVRDGVVNEDAPHVDLAVGNFTANGGDQYPLKHKQRTLLGITGQQALAAWLEHLGTVTGDAYPTAGKQRVVPVTGNTE